MSENIIVDVKTATAVVTMVKNQLKNETGKYGAYVTANNVTPENVAEHVKALREQAFPGIKADGRAEQGTPERNAKKFADKVRLGLRTAIGDSPAARKGTQNLLTATGLETLAGLDEDALLAAVRAEIAKRSK